MIGCLFNYFFMFFNITCKLLSSEIYYLYNENDNLIAVTINANSRSEEKEKYSGLKIVI